MFESAASLTLLSFPVFLTAAALSDFRRFIIPNWTSAALAVGFLLAHSVSGLGWASLGEHLLIGAGAFALAFGLFAIRFWGGGDGKLFAATALWFDLHTLLPFVLYTLLAGGALAIVGLSLYASRFQLWAIPWLRNIDFERMKTHTPYGVAIAAAALFTCFDTEIYRALDGF